MKADRIIRKVITWFLSIASAGVILISVSTYFVLRKYGDQLESYSIEKINSLINSKLEVEILELRYFKTFPYLSVVLINPVLHNSPVADTLLRKPFSAEQLFIRFNPVDLLFGKIEINRLYAKNGMLNISFDEQGVSNIASVLKKNAPNTSASEVNLLFEALKLSGFRINYENPQQMLFFSAHIPDIFVKTGFGENETRIYIDGNSVWDKFRLKNRVLSNKVNLNFALEGSYKNNGFEIFSSEIGLNNKKIRLSGIFHSEPEKSSGFFIESRNINLMELVSEFPDLLRIDNLKINKGKADVAARIIYQKEADLLDIKSVWQVNLNDFAYRNTALTGFKARGRYNYSKTEGSSYLRVEEYSLQDRKAKISGDIHIEDLSRPVVSVTLKGQLDIESLSELLNSESKTLVTGTAFPDLKIESLLLHKKMKLSEIDPSIEGRLALNKCSIKFPEEESIYDFEGSISFAKNKGQFNLFSNFFNTGFDLGVQWGRTKNTGEMGLFITGEAETQRFDLNTFFTEGQDSSSVRDFDKLFPQNLGMDIQITAGEILMNDFSITQLAGRLNYETGNYSLSNADFHLFEGRTATSLSLKNKSPDEMFLSADLRFRDVNLMQLFKGLNNFGQSSLSYENIEGLLSGEMKMGIPFHSQKKLSLQDVDATAYVKVSDGELNNFTPLKRLSRFADISELENLRFSELSNTLLLQKGVLTIPQMNIYSSAMNLTVAGIHDFNANYEYKIKILLSELMSAKKKNNQEVYYQSENQRRASLFLALTGNKDSYEIKYDRKEAVSSVKDDIKEEKQNLKTIFREEFGWFKKDSVLMKSKDTEPDFIFEWDEEDSLNKGVLHEEKLNKTRKNKIRKK